MSFGALAFLNPWLLGALAALPIIYWLLRAVPPRPAQVPFPPTRILVGLETREKTPAKTPWWLLILRLAAAALVILALAEPVLNASQEKALEGDGPVVLIVDNGWAAAPRWTARQQMLDRLVTEAEARNRPVIVVPTASPSKTPALRIEAPGDARSTAAAIVPQPFAPDRARAADALAAVLEKAPGTRSVVWLTDGIDYDGDGKAFAARLESIGPSPAVIGDGRGQDALGVATDLGAGGTLKAKVMRADGGPLKEGMVHAFSARGQRLAEAPFKLDSGTKTAEVSFTLPLELRNQVARVEIAGEHSAGAVSLLDARSQWQRVGLISGESIEQAQPLLAPPYYVQRALAPFAEVVQPKAETLAAGIDAVLKQNATVLVLADVGTLSGGVEERVDRWIAKGGVLVRFAGPRLEKGGDPLLPVPLRLGGRTLGGALSWSTPQPIAPFDRSGPFAGLDVPSDVTISRQVLADPARLGPDVEVWARLKDGTPLVTAAKRGQGRVILFHVTANSDWSNLPMSGLFVDMLRRIVALGQPASVSGGESVAARAETGETADLLAPVETLDGFGTLGQPPPTAQPLAGAGLDAGAPSLDHPPGYYGARGAPRAWNVLSAKSDLVPLPVLSAGARRYGYDSEAATPLKPWLLAAALALLLIDVVAVLLLQAGGLMRRPKRVPATAALAAIMVAGVLAASHEPARAQAPGPPPDVRQGNASADDIAREATSKVTFGYVLTGNAETDEQSRLGLSGLDKILTIRTAVEPGEPIGVSIDTDEIAFFPILYWPVLPDARALPDATVAKIDAYMKHGGLIVFDTQDYGKGRATGVAESGNDGTPLQRLLGRLDLPRLEPVPENHVLTKAFYLLRYFPGRWDGGQLWVEATSDEHGDDKHKARRADGVTSIIITSNDFAAAWALDERGRPIYPVVPGGEGQREMSFRTGINIVMHALTGNYKADQVHVPALLERLGQ